MADVIVVDEEDVPPPSSSTSASSSLPRRVQLSTLTHIPKSPFNLAVKKQHILQAENQKLFSEFVEHVVAATQDCPQVLEYLKKNHAKARTDYLSSVEFRNSLGRCLTRLEAKRSRVFVYIHELCTVLKQHKDRSRKKNLENTSTSTSDGLQSTVVKSESQTAVTGAPEQGGSPATQDEKPSTSCLQEEQQKVEKKASRASRKQIAYLENLLKLYSDEICRLQRAELSLDDLDAEDSLHIQEHKLKRKMMKIYNRLCELKDCSSLTGRIIERKILYSDTSYPEISRKIQRYINSPDVCMNPPDYQDILHQVRLASERHNLHLSSKELERIARKAFTDTGGKIQQRRHHDLLYDFGCQLTSQYKPDDDPALKDPALLRKLQSNRELGLNCLEDVINKYAVQQDNMDEETERARRHVREQEEEDDDDEDDVSSETDIEEEIQASNQQEGPDDDDEEDGGNEAEKMSDNANEEAPTTGSISVAAVDNEAVTSGLLSDAGMSGDTSASDSPSQSEPPPPRVPSPDESAAPSPPAASDEPPRPASPVTSNQSSGTDAPAAPNGAASPVALETTCHSPIANGASPLLSSTPDCRLSRSRKRKMKAATPKHNHIDADDREVETLLDMGVICASPTDAADCQLVSSSQSPPPKKNKVNVATQCDPLEIIELSDSE